MVEGRAPVQLPGRGQVAGQGLEALGQVLVLRPGCCQLGDGRQRGDVGLGGGDAELGARAECDGLIGQSGQGRALGVDHGDHQGPRRLGAGHSREQVGAAPRLGDRQAHRAGHAGGGSVEGADGRGAGRRDDAEPGLNQVFCEGRCVVGTAPADGDDRARGQGPQPRSQAEHDRRIDGELPGHGLRGLPRLAEHERGFGAWGPNGLHAKVSGVGQLASEFSSATKS